MPERTAAHSLGDYSKPLLLPQHNASAQSFTFSIAMHVLERFRVVLLDMNGTFMFGQDRFGADQDFFRTYEDIGGVSLSRKEVTRIIRATYDRMAANYESPDKYDNFPQVMDVLCGYAPALPERELGILDNVFGLHELGKVSDAYARFLRALAQTHCLGLVTNIWCKKPLWLAELRRAGVLHLFSSLVFSSDYKCMKPSPRMYEMALEPFRVSKSEVVFIGDSLRCDIEGAKKAGLFTIWINPPRHGHPAANIVVGDILELTESPDRLVPPDD